MAHIARRILDKRLLKLIRGFLRAGVMKDGLVSPIDEGTPQGGPLSPLLSNVVLDELDRELERRVCRVNYFCRSRQLFLPVVAKVKLTQFARFSSSNLR
jgi:RNA-directed DNA polymerase